VYVLPFSQKPLFSACLATVIAVSLGDRHCYVELRHSAHLPDVGRELVFV
jgi:hypothetical protein